MSDLISWLDKFNRKERFFLIGDATGNHTFALSEQFRNRVGEILNLSIPVESFNVIDYHIDWIYASIVLFLNNEQNKIFDNNNKYIKANQEDVDLFIAFKESNIYHLIMIEAKFKSSWQNKQAKSKVKRLKNIFNDDGKRWENIVPHFILISPRKPCRLDYSDYPRWMKPEGEVLWIPIPEEDKIKVTRCDNRGNKSEFGEFWKVEKN